MPNKRGLSTFIDCGATDAMPTDEWEDYWENGDDPMGPDDPDDYLSEADE